jgi:hypothetical protein
MDLKTICESLACSLLAQHLYDQATPLSKWLIGWAAARLKQNRRERFHEEWLSHLAECEGKLAKLWHGLGCCAASLRLNPPLVLEIGSAIARFKKCGLQIVNLLIFAAIVREIGKVARANASIDAEKYLAAFFIILIAATVFQNDKSKKSPFEVQ